MRTQYKTTKTRSTRVVLDLEDYNVRVLFRRVDLTVHLNQSYSSY